MLEKTMKSVIEREINKWIDSIKDDEVKKVINKDLIKWMKILTVRE